MESINSYAHLKRIVDRLVYFCQKNPFFWKNGQELDSNLSNIKFTDVKDEEERKEKVEELKKLKKDYIYLSLISNQKKLRLEDKRRLKDSGISNVMDELIFQEDMAKFQKYGIDKKILKSIIKDFGNLNNFEREYIEYFITRGECEYREDIEKYLKMLDGKIVTRIDLSNPNLVLKEDNYIRFNNVDNFEVFYDARQIYDETERRMKTFTPRMLQVVRTYNGLGEEEIHDTLLVGAKYNISRQRVIILMNSANERYLQDGPFMNAIEIVQKPKDRKRIIRSYFNTQGIFIDENMKELGKKKYDKIVGLTLYENQKQKKEKENNVRIRIRELKNKMLEATDRYTEYGHREEVDQQTRLLHKLSEIDKKINAMRISEWFEIDDTDELEKILGTIDEIETKITPIENLNLSTRPYNSLKRNGVDTIGVLMEKVSSTEKAPVFLGKMAYAEIMQKMKENGYFYDKDEQYAEITLQKLIQELNNIYRQLELKEKEYDAKISELEEIVQTTQTTKMQRDKEIQEILDTMFEEHINGEDKEERFERLKELLQEERAESSDETKKTSSTQKEHLEQQKQKTSDKKGNIENQIFRLSSSER